MRKKNCNERKNNKGGGKQERYIPGRKPNVKITRIYEQIWKNGKNR